MRPLESGFLAIKAAQEKKAVVARLYDIQRVTPFIDYIMLCTAGNSPHMSTVAESIMEALEASGLVLRRREGAKESGWIVLDFGKLVCHVFMPETREFYGLDSRWAKAREIHELE